MRANLAQRFLKKIRVTPSCWFWTASTRCNGYGSFKDAALVTVYAHRFSYEFYVGQVPDGLNVLHRCDNPRCVNPDHLFLGTHQDNMRDKVQKGRARGKFSKKT